MRQYFTQNKMNKPIRMMGLSSLQFIAVLALLGLTTVVMVTAGASLIGTMVPLVVEIIPIVFYTAKASMEHKKGNPNFLSSWYMFQSMPKKIHDGKGIVKYLKR